MRTLPEFIIISGFINDKNDKTLLLKKHLIDNNYNFIETIGVYKKQKEPSFIVFGSNLKDLESIVLSDYSQECILKSDSSRKCQLKYLNESINLPGFFKEVSIPSGDSYTIYNNKCYEVV